MIKLLANIVSEDLKLLGFLMEGKDIEFGGFTAEIVQKPMQMSVLSSRNFSNNQVKMSRGKIEEVGNFKINKLPMCLVKSNGYIQVSNEIEILKTIVMDNEYTGFVVRALGKERNLKYEELISRSNWFRPANYVVKTSATGKKFVTGKQGCPLSELPVIHLGEESKAKRLKPSGTESVSVSNDIGSDFDIIDLYDFIRECKGKILMLPKDKYELTNDKKTVAGSEFIPLGIGEISEPYLDVGESKLNANTKFKKPGVVSIDVNGQKLNVNTFVWRNKTLFKNGDNYVSRFGVVIPVEKENEFLNRFKSGLLYKEITEHSVIQPFMAMLGNSNLKFYAIDTAKVSMFSKKRIEESILGKEALSKVVYRLAVNKAIDKYLGTRSGVMKRLKDQGFVVPGSREVYSAFKLYDKQILQILEANGIDIYLGSYNKEEKFVSTSADSTELVKEVPLTIDYGIVGIDVGKLKYDNFVKKETPFGSVMNSLVDEVEALPDSVDKVGHIKKYLDKAKEEMNESKYILWKHKCAMFIEGGKEKIHEHDKADWVEVATRKKDTRRFECVVSELVTLYIEVSGVKMA